MSARKGKPKLPPAPERRPFRFGLTSLVVQAMHEGAARAESTVSEYVERLILDAIPEADASPRAVRIFHVNSSDHQLAGGFFGTRAGARRELKRLGDTFRGRPCVERVESTRDQLVVHYACRPHLRFSVVSLTLEP